MMNDYANQARNAVSGEPQQVLIVFDTKMSRKASRYFVTTQEVERLNILEELNERGAKYFLGDDSGENSVYKAYKEAFNFLENNSLYDPSKGDDFVKTFAETFPE